MKKFKKLLLALAPLGAVAIATPIILTSCSESATNVVYKEPTDTFEPQGFQTFKDEYSKAKTPDEKTNVITKEINRLLESANGISDLIEVSNYGLWKNFKIDNINGKVKNFKSSVYLYKIIEKNNSSAKKTFDVGFNLKMEWNATGTKPENSNKKIEVELDFNSSNITTGSPNILWNQKLNMFHIDGRDSKNKLVYDNATDKKIVELEDYMHPSMITSLVDANGANATENTEYVKVFEDYIELKTLSWDILSEWKDIFHEPKMDENQNNKITITAVAKNTTSSAKIVINDDETSESIIEKINLNKLLLIEKIKNKPIGGEVEITPTLKNSASAKKEQIAETPTTNTLTFTIKASAKNNNTFFNSDESTLEIIVNGLKKK